MAGNKRRRNSLSQLVDGQKKMAKRTRSSAQSEAQEDAASILSNMAVEQDGSDNEERCDTPPPTPVVLDAEQQAFLKIINTPGHGGDVWNYLVGKRQKERKYLLESKLDADHNQALHLAAIAGHWHLINTYLMMGADINAYNKWGMTALHLSAMHEHKEFVKALVNNKSKFIKSETPRLDLDAQNGNKQTALHYSAHNCHFEITEMLLKAGANPT